MNHTKINEHSRIVNFTILVPLLIFLTLYPYNTHAADIVHPVTATVETTPVSHSGDAADDSVVWVHPTDTAASLVVGTDKQGGIMLYDLTGKQLSYTPFGNINNIDIRYGFSLNGVATSIIAASNRSNNSIGIYKIDPSTKVITSIAARTITTDMTVYGFCMYKSAVTGKYYGLVNSQTGVVKQYEFFESNGLVDATLVRTFDVGTQVEGCVADDQLGHFYIGEESVGIWKYSAEPTISTDRVLIDSTNGGHLTSDVEGLTIYKGADETGYLLASSQGNNTYVAYERSGSNSYVATFEIVSGATIDGVSDTDGIKVLSFGLGTQFSQGLFIAQDGKNTGEKQNFKLVPWQSIATVAGLIVDTTQDPRIVSSTTATTTSPVVINTPTNVSATAISDSQINLQWTTNAGPSATTKVERSLNNLAFTNVATLNAGISAFSDTGLSPATNYYYRLTSITASGSSPVSQVVFTSTLAQTTTSSTTTTHTFTVNEDATVFSASPQTNYGSANSLEVDNSPNSLTYLKFQASGLQGTVKSAKLRIYVTNASTNGPAVHKLNATWAESTINFNNRPTVIGMALANKSKTTSGWQEYDVTTSVNGNGEYTFMFNPDSSDGLDFSARTGTNPSKLIVVTEF